MTTEDMAIIRPKRSKKLWGIIEIVGPLSPCIIALELMLSYGYKGKEIISPISLVLVGITMFFLVGLMAAVLLLEIYEDRQAG